MKGGKRSKMAVAASVIVVAAMVLAVAHFYVSADSQAISVQDSHLNVTYAAHYKNYENTTRQYPFSTNVSQAVVSSANHNRSTLSLSLQNGNIYFDAGPNQNLSYLYVRFDLILTGHFTTGLHPNSTTIFYNAQALKNQSIETLLAYVTPPQQVSNLSTYNLWIFNNVNGASSVNATAALLNENSSLPSYNFSISINMIIFINLWYPDSTHTFDFGAQVNGLGIPVVASVSMSIVELGN